MSGHVYAVASGKGGVGKTTTVVNLGVMLRKGNHTVALVDADLGMANLATLLGVDHEPTLHEVLAGEADLEEAIAEEAQGFGVVPSSRSLEGYAAADPTGLGDVLGELAERYEYVLVDTGAGLSHEDVLPLGLVDGVLLATSPDPAAVGDTEKTVELVNLVGGSIRGVVVTKATGSTDPESIGDRLGAEVLAVVPDDPAVAESTARGKPLAAYAPDGAATAAYARLADVLAGDADPGIEAPAGAAAEAPANPSEPAPPADGGGAGATEAADEPATADDADGGTDEGPDEGVEETGEDEGAEETGEGTAEPEGAGGAAEESGGEEDAAGATEQADGEQDAAGEDGESEGEESSGFFSRLGRLFG